MSRIWMLPEGVEEVLPDDAWALEDLRGHLLRRYREAGYQLVIPPPMEHLDALLTGAGGELEAQTFKLTDPASGRLLGLRADMTPQAARIAARHFADRDVVRLCYLGSVLRTQADNPGGARAPMQVGCEIFGQSDLEADLEVLDLMLRTLQLAGVRNVHLGLGHTSVFRHFLSRLKLGASDEAALFDILQRKSTPDLDEFATRLRLDSRNRQWILALMGLDGGPEQLSIARELLDGSAMSALDALERTVAELRQRWPEVAPHVDLADLRGYRYHTGLVFAAFVPGLGREVARGGRYDGAGREFGLARPATGFSADLNELLRLGQGDA